MIKLRQSEINRACNGWTVVTRPQSRGGVMVTTIHVETGQVWASNVVKSGEVHNEIRQQLRMLDKCGGMAGSMGDKARHRIGRKIEERKRKP